MSGEPSNRPGAYISFPYDRTMLGEFRRAFPRARWSDDRRNWFIPGKTADRRFTRWMDGQLSERDPFGESKGRDAYDFDPIGSPYLEAGDDLCLRTPFSRTIVEELRQVPWARWDDNSRTWHVPFRSYEELRKRWPVIEAAGGFQIWRNCGFPGNRPELKSAGARHPVLIGRLPTRDDQMHIDRF